ncbi:MAG: DUF1801 domain-containing protein [Reichenbachiella sp.]|uniref:DUF1801 domain-containing protein n=1 Tax=Reichenbachiella sp. TaxID=2184521 RepID=UPI0032666B8A
MTDILDFFSNLESPQRELMEVLHQRILVDERITCKLRFKIPFYFQKSWICYLNPLKNNGVELCFLRANELSNEQNLLDFKDRKQVAGISYYSMDQIDKQALDQILHEAIILDESVKYAAKRKK